MKFNNSFDRTRSINLFLRFTIFSLWTVLKKIKDFFLGEEEEEYFDPFFFSRVWSISKENRWEKVFFNTIIHARIHYIRTKCWTLNLFTNSFLNFDSFSWRNVHLGTQNIPLYQTRYYIRARLPTTILFISKLQMLTASHYPSLCSITNASYIVIIAWNLSAIGSRRIRTIIVESSYFEDELIERGVKSITRDTSRISFFFLNFILENFIFLCFLGKIDLWNVRRMYIVFFNFMMVF